MKKIFILLLCIGLLFSTSVTAAAYVRHFDDGHKTKEFEEQGISLEITKMWSILPLDGAWAFYPDTDVIFLLQFFEYGEGDLRDKLVDVFLISTTENSLTGMTGVDQKGNSEIFELSNGNRAAAASYVDDENTYAMASTLCGSQIIILGFQAAQDKYTDEYIDDLDSILSSAKEI